MCLAALEYNLSRRLRREWAASRLSRPASPYLEARHVGQSGVCTTTGDSQPALGHHCGEGALGRLASALRRCWARPADGPRNRSSRARWSWAGPRVPSPRRSTGPSPRRTRSTPLRTARQAESQSASIRRETVRTARPASGDRQGGRQTATRDAPAPFPVPSCVVRGARTLSEQSHASSVARPRTGAGGAARRPGVGAGSAGALDRSEGSADQSGKLPEADGVERRAGQRRSGWRPVPRPTPYREHHGGA